MTMATASSSADALDIFEDATGLGCAKEYFKEHEEVYSIIDGIKTGCLNAQTAEVTLNRFWYLLDQYQEQPHLLDPHLECLLGKLLAIIRNSKSSVQHLAFKFLFVISKVRAHKVVVRYMPHEVNDLQFIMELLSQQDPSDIETWQTRYMLLIWLSIVVMIPFHMSRMDAIMEGQTNKPMIERIMDVVKFYLCSPDSPAKAAVTLAGRFLTRPDSTASQLKEFIDWMLENLSLPIIIEKHHQLLAALANLFKHGKREDMIPFCSIVLKYVMEKKCSENNNSLVRKMSMKLVQRIGLTFLKVRIAPWRYSRGTRSLAVNLVSTVSVPSETEMQIDDDDYDVPPELEEIIEILLKGLRDLDFTVRWSAAKGVGRVTGRLPKDMADDVVVSILDLFVPREAERSWHGGCIALAELGRRGLLLPHHLDRVIPVVKKALIFDENKGNFSVGSYIRDAACYVCWAFARAYEPSVLVPYVQDIAESLLITALFDREVPCRRAASAAIQENVGRQGTFPNGIDIVTTVDYSSVALMSHTFLELSVTVAKFQEYTLPLIDHLLLHKINHWDVAVRRLAARALGKLTASAPGHVRKRVLPALLPLVTGVDYDARHGAVLAMAEIIAALGELKGEEGIRDSLDGDSVEKIRNIVTTMRTKNLFQGIGADMMREATCVLVERLCRVSFLDGSDRRNLATWREFLQDCLKHVKDSVQAEAAGAFSRFCQSYLREESQEREYLLNNYLSQLGERNPFARRGYALAVGSLPKFMLDNSEATVVSKLIECASISKPEELPWVASRSCAVYALLRVVSTIGVSALKPAEVNDIFECLLEKTTEYVKDVNGDIATVVRKAALESLKDFLFLLVDARAELLTPEVVQKAMCAILRQCCDIVESTRIVSIKIFQQAIWRLPPIPNVPHSEELREILSPTVCEIMSCNLPSDTFPVFVKILDLKTYTYTVLLGIACCIGSKTGSLIKHSQSALQTYFSSRKLDLPFLCDCFLRIYREHPDETRFVVPFLHTADFLLFCGALDSSDDAFLRDLFAVSVKAAYLSRDVFRVQALTGILSGLLQFEASRSDALSYLVKLLYHQYPKVRKSTAEKMYEAVIAGYEIVDDENVDRALEILGETNWASAKREDVRPAQLALSKMLISVSGKSSSLQCS